MADGNSGSAPAQRGPQRLAPMALNLLTGTAMSLAAQAVTDMDLADNSVQALAWTKYVATVGFTAVQQRAAIGQDGGGSGRRKQFSSRTRRLMTVIGILDLVAYALHCLGFAYCGAATAAVVFAAAAQVFTALMTRFVLGRQLSRGQVAAVGLVLLGILVRGSSSGKANGMGAAPPDQRLGYAAILGSALGYSCLGVVYDVMVHSENPSPGHGDIMLFAGKIGLVATTAYQVVYTLPRWRPLVAAHLAAGGTSLPTAAAALAAFGAVYVGHTFAQGAVQRADGALAVGLVSAVRSATVSVGAHLLFCGSASPWQCLTPRKAASAAVVTAGGIVWVLSKRPASEGGCKVKKP